MKKVRSEFILLLCLLLFAGGCIFTVSSGVSLGMKNERITPQRYSDILSWLLIALIMLKVILSISDIRKIRESKQEEEKREKPSNTFLVFAIMGLGILYVVGISSIGFYVSTAIILFLLYMSFESWNKKLIPKGLFFSLGVCLIFFIVFRYLKIYLPNALLF